MAGVCRAIAVVGVLVKFAKAPGKRNPRLGRVLPITSLPLFPSVSKQDRRKAAGGHSSSREARLSSGLEAGRPLLLQEPDIRTGPHLNSAKQM